MKNLKSQYSNRGLIWISILLFSCSFNLAAQERGLALTPPMGWNSVNGLEFILLEFRGKEVVGDWINPRIISKKVPPLTRLGQGKYF